MYINKHNLVVLIITIFGVLSIKTVGVTSTIAFIYSERPLIEFLIALIIGSLSFVKILIIIKHRGIAGFFSEDFRFLGTIGDIALKGVSIFTIIYSGFIVSSLILLGLFPGDLPKAGLFLMLLLVSYLFAIGGSHTFKLINEVIFTPTPNPAEGKLEKHEDQIKTPTPNPTEGKLEKHIDQII